MKTMTLHEFHAALRAQSVKDRADLVFICPMCQTPQTANDLIKAGAGADFDAVAGKIGFSCIGRFTGAGSPRREPDGKPCNWTLGGLFQMHKLEVVTDDGNRCPHFEPATPEQVLSHHEAAVAAQAVA